MTAGICSPIWDQNDFESSQQISMKSSGNVDNGPRKRRLDFSEVLDSRRLRPPKANH